MSITKIAKCSYCEFRDMVPVPHRSGIGFTPYLWCPNCDNGKGKTLKNSYDGVGPKK